MNNRRTLKLNNDPIYEKMQFKVRMKYQGQVNIVFEEKTLILKINQTNI